MDIQLLITEKQVNLDGLLRQVKPSHLKTMINQMIKIVLRAPTYSFPTLYILLRN